MKALFVICVNAAHVPLTLNRAYIALPDVLPCYYRVNDDNGHVKNYSTSRFSIVEDDLSP